MLDTQAFFESTNSFLCNAKDYEWLIDFTLRVNITYQCPLLSTTIIAIQALQLNLAWMVHSWITYWMT